MKSSSIHLNVAAQPRVSVFITSYNQKAYLLEAIESVLDQTLPPWEIIIVDDSSTDGSQELIQNYVERFPDLIKPIFHQTNTGVTRSRIDALETVRGDYVTYVDGDDRFLPTKLEKEYAALCQAPNAQIAFSNYFYMNDRGDREGMWIEDDKPPQGNVFVQTFGRIFPKRTLYRAELVEYAAWKKIGFHDLNLSIYKDFDMRIRMTKQLQTVYCDEPLSEYRLHGEGLSNSPRSLHQKSLDYIFQKNRGLLMELETDARIGAEQGFLSWRQIATEMAIKELEPKLNINDDSSETSNPISSSRISRTSLSPEPDYRGHDLIFIVSQPRAGSTMLQRLISGHSEIHATAEPWLMLHPLYALKHSGIQSEYRSHLARNALQDFLSQFPDGESVYIQSLRLQAAFLYHSALNQVGKRYFLDKTPRYYHILPDLYRVFPEAKFILLFRNPLAVFSSTLKTWLNNDLCQIDPATRLDLYEAPKKLIEGARFLKENAIIINYEQLVTHPLDELKRLFVRLELPFNNDLLEYGFHAAPAGRFGDSQNVHRHAHPVTTYINKWMTNLNDPDLVDAAEDLLMHLGEDTLSQMGYSFPELKITIARLKNGVLPGQPISPNTSELLLKGKKLMAANKIEEAAIIYKNLIEENPLDAEALLGMAHVSLASNRPTDALDFCVHVQRIAPQNRMVDSILAKIGQTAIRSSDKPEKDLRSRIRDNVNQGQLAEAVHDLQILILQEPDSGLAHNDLGVIFSQMGETGKAAECYRRAVVLEPSNATYQKNLADHLYVIEGQPEAAEAIYRALAQDHPGDAEVWLGFGKIKEDQNNLDEAVVMFEKAIALDPNNAIAHRCIDALRKNIDSLPSTSEGSPATACDSATLSKRCVVEDRPPVLVYQMGKVGSTTIRDSLDAHKIYNQHTHLLSWEGIRQAEERYRRMLNGQIPERIVRYRALREFIDHSTTDTRWQIITLVRDPIARLISSVFQNLDVLFPDVRRFDDHHLPRIEQHILDQLRRFKDETGDDAVWFDNELKHVFGFDIFKESFDTRQGYCIYHREKVDVLAIRLEQLTACASQAFGTFLGLEDFKLTNANVSRKKTYQSIYRKLLASITIPEDVLSHVYASRLAEHFYSPSEIEDFKKHWRQNRVPKSFGWTERGVRVSAIVSTYNSERFIKGRLQNLIQQSLFQKEQLEIIVIDSNSCEDERAIVNSFRENYPQIKYIRTPVRESVYAAWNRGIKSSCGTYFVNANTDDRFDVDSLEAMANTLDAQPEYDAVYGNWLVTQTPNDTFESNAPKRLFFYPEFHPGLFFYLQITSHASFVRRSVFDQIGYFNGSYTVFGDREFMFRFSATGHKALKLDRLVGLYLENPTSVERTNRDVGRKECIALYKYHLEPKRFARLMGYDIDVSPKSLSQAYTEVGCFGFGLYTVNGKSEHALGTPTQLFAKAIELDPKNIEALNNMGVVAQYRHARQDACRLFSGAKSLSTAKQTKIINHNLLLARKGISDPNQLRFIYPADFKPINVIESEYPAGSMHPSNIGAKSGGPKLKKGTHKKHKPTRNKKKRKRSGEKKRFNLSSQARTVPFESSMVWPARIEYLNDKFPSAMTSLQNLIIKNDDHWEAYALLVDVMLQSGQASAIPEQLRPLENRSDLPAWVVALIGGGYEAAGDLSKATEFADRALSMDDRCAQGWNLKGVIDYRNGDKETAYHNFQKATEGDAGMGDSWTNLGTIYWDQGNVAKALDCFEKGFALSPTAPNVATTYHAAVSEAGWYERAKPVFEDAVKRHPDFRRAHFLLIDILIHLEAYPTALDQIEHVIAHFGADPQFLEAAKAVRGQVGPMDIKKAKRPSLSLCMIVKDEEKYLPRCLESLKPIVDEMIIVDTGSTDATRDIAEIFGAQMYRFEWKDDFAVARNYSLEKASGDWILVMDADEVIATKDHEVLIELIQNAAADNSTAYVMTTRNYTDRRDSADWVQNLGEYSEEKSTGWVPSRKVRLFRNYKGVHFVFPVHEQVDPVLAEMGVPLVECPVSVHHFGKLDRRRTSERWQMYYDIGKAKLTSNPDDDNALKELAVQAGLLSRWEEAARYWEKYLDRRPQAVDACMNLTRVMAKCGDFEKANRYAQRAYQLSSDRTETIYNLALSELQIGQAEKAAKTAGQMLAIFPKAIDGKLLHVFADMCAGKMVDGLTQIQDLIPQIPQESLLSRALSIIASIRYAGLDEWVDKLVLELSPIDGLQDLATKVAGLPVHKPQAEFPPKLNTHDEEASQFFDDAVRSYEKEDYRAAFNLLEQSITVQSDRWEAYRLVVDVMLQCGREADIPELLSPLEDRSDLPAWVIALIGSGYEAAGDLTRAAEFADQAIAVDINCAQGWNLKGVIDYQGGVKETAYLNFRKATDCDRRWGDPWTNLGTIHWDQGNGAKALDCFEKGLALSPTAPNVATTYHIAISETGQYDRAKPVFEKIVRRHPDYRKARFLLIDILVRLKAYRTALDQIEFIMVRLGTDPQLLAAAKAVRKQVGPLSIKKGRRPSLSLCMIVRNEEKFLPRCLESLKPIVDEMIVVDTGSTDTTRDIAEIFGAQVFDIEWQDDFAAARNYSLEKASGDWILVMDADEVIAVKDHKKIQKRLARSKSKRHAYMVVTRNYTDQYNIVGWEPNSGQYPKEEAGKGWIPSEKVRLFPNDKDIRFDYPVHEVLGPSLSKKKIPMASFPYPVHHYGKLDQNTERQKDEHYYQIGMEKLSASQDDPVAIRELAIQAAKLGKHADSILLWKRMIERQPNDARSYVNLASNHGKLKQYREARKAAHKAVKISPNLKEGHINLGLSELHLGNPAKAEHIFNKIAVKFVNYYAAIFLLGASQLCQGKIEKGVKTLQTIKKTDIGDNLSFAIQELVESLMAAGWPQLSRDLIVGSDALKCSNEKIREYSRRLEMEAA